MNNYDALRALDWQTHVYGTPDPRVRAWCAARGLPLLVFSSTRAARRAGLARDAVYLVRPDGYVGLAAPRFERVSLESYAERCRAASALSAVRSEEALIAG